MKKKSFILASLAGACAFSLASCKFGPDPQPEEEFDFSIALTSGKTTLQVGDSDHVEITSNLPNDSVTRVYTYETSNANRLSVDANGYVVAEGEVGSVRIKVTETNSQITKSLDLTIVNATPANGGYNYSSAAGEEAIKTRTEILGKLEKYAVDSHLTGITLFENGGYVKYNPRLQIPASEYITGYGFGILSEGDITADLATETVEAYKRYYHSAQTQDPAKINAWNASGSAVSDLSGYITSSYYGNKMNSSKTGYDWYPVLAKDGEARPTPIYDAVNPLGLYKTWRIYVKTGSDARPLKYRYGGTRAGGFDGRAVALEDYKFVFQLLLTGANKQSRGAEMAADKTYGIRGAQAYYNRTKDMTDQALIDATWAAMTLNNNSDPAKFKDQELGIMTGEDAKGKYIQLELLNEIDAFTAMYQLSSNLYSPIPRAFIEALAPEGTVMAGILNYGQNSTGYTIPDNTISLGAYYLETWNDSYLTFKQDETWVERSSTDPTIKNRHKIKGVKITTYPNATQEQLYQYYYSGLLDSCGIPISHIQEEIGKTDVRRTKGDATFKLNVNTCTQERWNELNTKLWKNAPGQEWNVKPWMSNDNFLNGLYWSINRKQFAENKGAQPSIDYLSSAYLNDPENGKSYNDSDAHKKAVAKWHNVRTLPNGQVEDDYGYDYSKAVECFKAAVNELARAGKLTLGTKTNPTPIEINIRWMYQTDVTDYGNDIKNYFESAFNDDAVCGGKVKLTVTQDFVTNWEDVYNVYMMKGRFDLAFGAISGNTYNPLNFLEVLKSDNSSGFTLNWGPDTSALDAKNPIIYDGHTWSFDALWEVSDRGGVVENGVSVKTVKNYYFDGSAKTISGGAETSNYSVGVDQSINLEFVDLEGVQIDVTKVQVYVVGGSNVDVSSFSYNKASKKLSLRLDASKGASIKEALDGIYNKNKTAADTGYIADIFSESYYNTYWTFEIYYNLSIRGGTPSQSYVTVALTQDQQQ